MKYRHYQYTLIYYSMSKFPTHLLFLAQTNSPYIYCCSSPITMYRYLLLQSHYCSICNLIMGIQHLIFFYSKCIECYAICLMQPSPFIYFNVFFLNLIERINLLANTYTNENNLIVWNIYLFTSYSTIYPSFYEHYKLLIFSV